MKNLILLLAIVTLVSAGYFVFRKDSPISQLTKSNLSGSSRITSEQALEKVKKIPEVQDYLQRVPAGIVALDNEEGGEYNIQVFEVKNGHTATFNWYRVNIKDGKIEGELLSTEGTVSGKLCYPSEVVPEGVIEAKRLADGKISILNHQGSEDENGINYKFKLEEGDYYLRFKSKNVFSGYSTIVCPTGEEETCGDTKQREMIKAQVRAGEAISGYDLCDYYYTDTNAPKF